MLIVIIALYFGSAVRLTGPVKGRGSICRDLRSDLTRVRDLGVGCIIWYVIDSVIWI